MNIVNTCIHVDGGQFLKSTTNTPAARYPKVQLGYVNTHDQAVISDDMAHVELEAGTTNRTASGYVHVFIKELGLKKWSKDDASLGEFLWSQRKFPDAAV